MTLASIRTSRAAQHCVVAFLFIFTLSQAYAGPPVATGTGGAAATVNQHATRAAMAILDRGGNAVDAAVAAAATLGVTDPFSCGIGGGGFMVIYLAKDKRVITVEHREMAPAAFTPDAFRPGGKPMDYETAIASGMSVGVPGTVRGWHEALERYGTMNFKQVLAPAIAVAEKGYPVTEIFHHLTAENETKFRLFEGASALYLKDGKAVPVGTQLRNPGMARAYREIAAGGYKAFYEGAIARAIVDAVNRPATTKGVTVVPGQMTLADLANYEARIRQPLHTTYRGYDLYGMPAPSSGAATVGLALNILEGYDLKAMPRAQAEHLYLEASRLAFADRNAYLGDPEYVEVPMAGLLSKAYAAQRRALIDPARASAKAKADVGDPYPFQN
ncbi:MAG TPA: gamma-glutamyltransferase, partial [Burkholderiaceae bacterium]